MREPIRVLHLVNQLTVGGSERQLHVLIRGLDRDRVRSSVGFLRIGRGELLEPLRALDTRPEEYSLRGSLAQWNTLTQLRRIAARCRRERIDLVHAHDLWAEVLGLAAARLARRPIVISRRDLADFRPAGERRLLRLVTRFADGVVVNAASIRELAVHEGAPPERVHVIPNGIDVARFDHELGAPLRAPLPPRSDGTRRIAVIGNMDRAHKGHDDVLQAAARLRGRPIDWLLLSDGPLRPRFEERARQLGVAGLIHFVGRRADVPAVLAHVDLLVHASWSEGFPNVVLEACCARLPVIATDVGGTPELVRTGATGILTQPANPRELASAISSLLEDWPRAIEYGRAGRALVESSFTVEKMVARVERIYAVIAGRAGGRRGSDAECLASERITMPLEHGIR